MPMQSLNDGWQEMADKFDEFGMDAKQIVMMRYAFYAGCAHMMQQVSAMGQPDVTDDAAVKYHQSLQTELATIACEGLTFINEQKARKH